MTHSPPHRPPRREPAAIRAPRSGPDPRSPTAPVGAPWVASAAVRGRGSRGAAVLLPVLLLAGACSGGDRPELGAELDEPVTCRDPEAAREDNGLTVRRLDPERAYVARAESSVPVFSAPDVEEQPESVTPPTAAEPTGGIAIDGFLLQAPYEAEPACHRIALPDGSEGWVRADDVEVEEVNIVAVGNGTQVEVDGSGGGTVQVFAEPDAPQPLANIENPKSAEGLNVGPVVFLANGPVDPAADWLNVLLPVRPNGSDGWVRRRDVTLTANEFRIDVELTAHRLRVFDGDERVMEAPIGVGTTNTPTPGGAFYIRSLIASTDPVYGTYAFGLSGFSEVHETFNGGPGDIGIHGTNDPGTIGTDVSNGCIRLEDGNVVRLAEILPEATGAQSDAPAITTGLGVPVRIIA